MTPEMPLTDLPRALIEAGYETLNYRALYEAARSARFPAERGSAGRWTFRPQDLGEIADCLGLKAYAA